MAGRRAERAGGLVREEISRLLLFKIKDPRLSSVTITDVRMSGDLRRAVVRFSMLEDGPRPEEVKAVLEKASGYLKREIGRVLELKFIPELIFEHDRSMQYAQHMDRLLTRLAAEDKSKDHDESE